MRRPVSIAGAVALTAAMAVPAMATPPLPEDGHTVLVCHATSSASNPYLAIVVDIASAGGFNKYMGHRMHADDPNKKNGPDYIQGFTYDPLAGTCTVDELPMPGPEGYLLDEDCSLVPEEPPVFN